MPAMSPLILTRSLAPSGDNAPRWVSEECVEVCLAVMGAYPHLPIKRSCGTSTEVDRAHLRAFAFDNRHALIKIELIQPQTAGFANPYATVEQEPD